MTRLTNDGNQGNFGALLPEAARHYIAHTTQGRGIRDIARHAGCHASTVLRHVRKTEGMRDDPLIAAALNDAESATTEADSDANLFKDAVSALRDLCLPGAMILFNTDVQNPAVVQVQGEGAMQVLRTVARAVAASFVLRGWVSADGGASVKGYRITPEGRSALPGLFAARDHFGNRHGEMATQDDFGIETPDRRFRDRSLPNGPGTETPLTALARRRGKDGEPFLNSDFVKAGRRLSEDFHIGGLAQEELLGWNNATALTGLYEKAQSLSDTRQADAIRRTLDAVSDLGPGLSDVALRCCCLHEGLEATEKRLGWSARSGKIVLKIALHRLSRFYAATQTNTEMLIG